MLVTGWDILFFWVARMMMMGMYFMKDVPFRTVYLHGLVTDEKGQKMSKSKGNAMDPLELIDKYGADALRFTMTSLAANNAGRLRLAPARVEGSRNFATKFWNATRFAEMNGAALPKDFDPATVKLTINKWVLGELARANAAIDKAPSPEFRLNEAATDALRVHLGHRLRLVCRAHQARPAGRGRPGQGRDARRHRLRDRETAKLLHPVMPFITEELWDKLGHRAEHGMLIGQPWPQPAPTDAAADAEIGWLVTLISDIRSARSELNVPAGAKLKLLVVGANDTTKQRIETHRAAIERLARIEGIEAAAAAPKAALQLVVGEATYALAGRRRHRPQGRERAPAEGDQEARRRDRQDRRQARQRRLRRRARPRRSSRSSASAASRPSRPAPASARRWNAWGSERRRPAAARAGDADALHALFTEPGVRQYLFDDILLTREETRKHVEAALTHDAWVVELDGLVVGFTSLRPVGADRELMIASASAAGAGASPSRRPRPPCATASTC